MTRHYVRRVTTVALGLLAGAAFAAAVHGVQRIYQPKQRTVKQARSTQNSYKVRPNPEVQTWVEPRNVVAEDVQGDLDEINTMISEGGPSR